MTRKFTMTQIESTAKYRRAGYLDAVKALGRIEGENVVLDDESYWRIRADFGAEEVPLLQWPAWALSVRALRHPDDRGVGDTIHRRLGFAGALFQSIFKRVFKRQCACDTRRKFLNKKLPYTTVKTKILATLLLMLTAFSLPAQFSYTLSTNLTVTNTIQSGVTLTYGGTNYIDVSRFKSIAVVATGRGTNYSTNTLTFTFLAGPTTSNWTTLPRYTLSGTIYGTNGFVLTTNIDCSDVGYLKPYQVFSSVTNAITNAWVYGLQKAYPRN